MRCRRLLLILPLLFAATCAKVTDVPAQANVVPAPQAHGVKQAR